MPSGFHELPTNTPSPIFIPDVPLPTTHHADTLDPEKDDIRTEYHPKSARPPTIDPFHLYGHAAPAQACLSDSNDERKPWSPFRERLDYEIAELLLEATLNEKQIAKFLTFFHRCRAGEPFTIMNYQDYHSTWELASTKSVKVGTNILPCL